MPSAEGARIEARRAESGEWGSWGAGQPAPSPPARGSGERLSSPAGSGSENQPKSNLVLFRLKI